jgi:hypothetical protein
MLLSVFRFVRRRRAIASGNYGRRTHRLGPVRITVR